MKVALIGTHGVGKTTLCYELAARLKRLDVNLEMVREVARRCPLPINTETSMAAQEWILHTQMAGEIEAESRHELALCDRSVLDNYCYLVHASGTSPMWEGFLNHWMETYDMLIYVPIWRRPAFDGVRAVDPSFQERIDVLLNGMLAARGLEPYRLDPSRHQQWGADIVQLLEPKLQPTPALFDPEELGLEPR